MEIVIGWFLLESKVVQFTLNGGKDIPVMEKSSQRHAVGHYFSLIREPLE